ncbi:hypothetical protein EYV94_28285 [Puteibacter caeruleilacunae]|nr:hypothetical protein EYV94_28285 [Puteibacter caeruleilacunae]
MHFVVTACVIIGIAIIATVGANDAVTPTGNPQRDAEGMRISKERRDLAWKAGVTISSIPLLMSDDEEVETADPTPEELQPDDMSEDGPIEPYNRRKHYGNSPKKSDREHFETGEGEEVDHDSQL